MKNLLSFLLITFSFVTVQGQTNSSADVLAYSAHEETWENQLNTITKQGYEGTLVNLKPLFDENWANFPQTLFWAKIMKMSPDSCFVNIASNRQIVAKMALKDWMKQTVTQKEAFRDSVRLVYHLDSTAKINVTTGKSDFYKFDKVYGSLAKGIKAFAKNDVDPWYAQAILLIESPAQLRKSSTGAYGAFQLMPGVARSEGLIVNRHIDERADFNRSAYAASNLIKTICLPYARQILATTNLEYKETDWWFRLFVMHIYHAGASNVRAVVAKIGKVKSGQELIQKMWQTTAAGFGNNSQNYSQLALAAQLIIYQMTNGQSAKDFNNSSILSQL